MPSRSGGPERPDWLRYLVPASTFGRADLPDWMLKRVIKGDPVARHRRTTRRFGACFLFSLAFALLNAASYGPGLDLVFVVFMGGVLLALLRRRPDQIRAEHRRLTRLAQERGLTPRPPPSPRVDVDPESYL